MTRKEYIEKNLKLGLCSCAFLMGGARYDILPPNPSTGPDDELEVVKNEKKFIENWLIDLLDTMDSELDRETRIRLIEGCGKGCFNRHQFKKDIANDGKGSIDELIEAYKRNFEIWKEGDTVHIRYGETSSKCYCPAAKFKPVKPGDLHCECTRMTHQTIFETAMNRPFKVDILESLRRGGKTCHFLVHLD